MNRRVTLEEQKVSTAENIIFDYILTYHGGTFTSNKDGNAKYISANELRKIIVKYTCDEPRTLSDKFGNSVFNQIVYLLKFSDDH